MTLNRMDDLMDQIAAWAEQRPDVFAVLVVGSYGRANPPPDRWSDLDLVVFVASPAPYLDDGAWLEHFGAPLLRVLDREADEAIDSEWRVVYDDGVKLDFVFARADPLTAAQGAEALMAQSMHTDAYARGTRILFDRANPANNGRFVRQPLRPRRPLAEQELIDHLHHTWMEALRAAKLTRRRDLFRAMMDVNRSLKLRLLRLAEWHARALHGDQADVWYSGRHLDQWADARVLAALPETVAGYDADSISAALDRTLDMAGWLAREIAEQHGFAYPGETETRVMALLGALRDSA